MTVPDYEYHGLLASTWDLLRGDTSTWEDRGFYIQIINKSGFPVLDVGCGTGRLLLDYLSLGMDIEGVDNSPEMLTLCRKKAEAQNLHPILYEGTMQEMHLPRKYQTILVPSSSFQLVLDPLEARSAIRNFYDHLLPGGMLVMPFMLLWRTGEPLEKPWKLMKEITRPEDGATIRRWSSVRYDPQNQMEHTQDRFEVLKDEVITYSELHQQSPATREYSQQQAMQLYSRAGFVNVNIYKGFTFETATEGDWIFTITGKKP